ncbi:MAG: DUF1501 domain-containing protein [Candidatus Eisenbacteria bacterium]|nr:DUF1501 domain-containing protein [Candidatus Eisenbacteria bacterium]
MNRRDFLQKALALSAAGLIVPESMRKGNLFGAAPAFAGTATDAPFNGRILIWLNLSGGNDGVNTVIPYADPQYYAVRPTIAVPANQVLPLTGSLGLNPALQPLMSLWNAGKMAVVEGVGYPSMNLSHFRGTDIWFSGSAEEVLWETGWLARYLEAMFPDFPYLLPDSPYGLQQSDNHRIPLNGTRGLTGIVVDDPSSFYYLVNETYPGEYGDNPPPGRGAEELNYVRTLDQLTFEYASAIQAASDAGTNTVTYPETSLGTQMQIIAKLISGGLKTPVFLCTEYGFDTHAYQLNSHGDLLGSVGQSIAALWADLNAQGYGNKVCILTTSEFGRRVEENGSYGTDHGTAAPHFVIGNGVSGGVYGGAPNLTSLDEYGNLLIQNDYRSLLATVLRGHFGASSALMTEIFGGNFAPLPFMQPATDAGGEERFTDRLHLPSPNPVRPSLGQSVELRFELARPAQVSMRIFDLQGRQVAQVADGTFSAGVHRVDWRPGNLTAGAYLVRMEQAGARPRHAKVVVV